MKEDSFLVIGIIVLCLAIPAAVSALREGRAPRVPAILIMIGGGLLVLAMMNRPGGYQVEDIMAAFRTVFGRLMVMLGA